MGSMSHDSKRALGKVVDAEAKGGGVRIPPVPDASLLIKQYIRYEYFPLCIAR